MARARHRTRNKQFPLYHSETVHGFREIRRVSAANGHDMTARGLWREVYDSLNNLVGYQVMPSMKDDLQVLSMRSSTAMVARDIVLNAGQAFKGGKSRTAGMTEDQRLTRRHNQTGKVLPPEDAVERVEAKIRVYPEITGAKQDILRVWPRNGKKHE